VTPAFASVAALPSTLALYVGLIGTVALERLVELAISTRNARRAFAAGGIEAESRGFYAAMVGLHAAFLVAAPLEVALFARPFVPAVGWPMLSLVALAMALRYWAIAALGERWNTRVIVVPGRPAVDSGPYRFVRHPNYVAVIVEMLALPLVHSAWLTALLFSAANAWLLARRIVHEEAALAAHADYVTRLGDRARFLPGGR
jgi:methyltransferase